MPEERHLRIWAFALGGAVIYSAAQAYQLMLRGDGIPWLMLFLYELPVWITIVLLSPAIFFVARKLPLLGSRSMRNVLLHFIPAAGILMMMFLIVESVRKFAVIPLVKQLGLAVTQAAIEYRDFTANTPVLESAVRGFRFYVMVFLFIYFAIVILHQALAGRAQLMEARLRSEQLETQLARSQLDALKLQLQPHFLFNTLNAVSSLMSRDVLLARRTLARLSDLLRQSLRDSTRHEVPLSSELEFLDAYLEIQRARFGSRLIVARDMDHRCSELLVPRMLLQPLVENCIRHGMRDGDEALVIHLRISNTDDRLKISVYDNGRGLPDASVEEGLGLRNMRERLDQLYDNDYDVSLNDPPGGGFEVVIDVPARTEESMIALEARRDIA